MEIYITDQPLGYSCPDCIAISPSMIIFVVLLFVFPVVSYYLWLMTHNLRA